MFAFLNFILIFALIIALSTLIKRATQKFKANTLIMKEASKGFHESLSALMKDTSQYTEETFVTLRLMTEIGAHDADPDVLDAYEAALMSEISVPSNEGDFAFLSEEQRGHMIQASLCMMIYIMSSQPRRWGKYNGAVSKDETLPLRALRWTSKVAQRRDL